MSTLHSDLPAQAAEVTRLREIISQLSYLLHGLGHDLREPIRTITCYAALLQQQGGIGVNHDTLEYLHFVSGAAQRLQALFQNLVSNAIKYRAAEPPEIFVNAQSQDGDWPFSIRDNGIGIDRCYLDGLFAPFRRLHGQEIAGAGLGLAIYRYIVERHADRI